MIKIEKRKDKELEELIDKTIYFGCGGGTTDAIIKDNTVVGFIRYFKVSMISTLELDTIEILEEFRNKGYASEAIKELFNMYPSYKKLRGWSDPDAVGFWDKIGAEFYPSCDDCNQIECSKHPDFDEEEEEFYTVIGPCDDYNENSFTLNRFKLILQTN